MIFNDIYHKNQWGNPESRSGSGSTLKATRALRDALPELIANLSIKSMLDIPCGDFNWMQHVGLDIDYIGADIVPEMIERNNALFAAPNRTFQVLDLRTDPLPVCDLIMCRDCLVHLSFEDAFAAMENICKSGAKYLLTTTFPLHNENVSLKTGESWYPINLQADPFPLGEPMLLLNERCEEPYYWDKCMALWRID